MAPRPSPDAGEPYGYGAGGSGIEDAAATRRRAGHGASAQTQAKFGPAWGHAPPQPPPDREPRCGCRPDFEGHEPVAGMGEGFMGRRIGRYQLGARIYGDRKHSEVREGLDTTTGEKVAVKLFCGRSAEVVNGFNEANILQELDHRNIVRLRGTAQDGDVRATVVEWLEGRTLRRRVTKLAPLSESQARPVFQQLLLALDHCHGRGIAHRDIKPENVMLAASGRTVLLDFGFAVRSRPGEFLRKSCGTVLFMSPEVLGKQPYDGPQASKPRSKR
eukprot:tig00020563_g11188.t1